MRRILAILLIMTGTLVSSCQGQYVQSNAYNTVLKTMLNHDVPEIGAAAASKLDSEYIFLDTRSLPEYQVSHIKKAFWVGYDEFKLDKVKGLKKDQKIIVYCSVGYRSGKVTKQLQDAGFTNLHNMYGGIFEWVNLGLPIVDAKGPTNKVHGFSKSWGIWLKKGEKVYK